MYVSDRVLAGLGRGGCCHDADSERAWGTGIDVDVSSGRIEGLGDLEWLSWDLVGLLLGASWVEEKWSLRDGGSGGGGRTCSGGKIQVGAERVECDAMGCLAFPAFVDPKGRTTPTYAEELKSGRQPCSLVTPSEQGLLSTALVSTVDSFGVVSISSNDWISGEVKRDASGFFLCISLH